MIRPFLLLLAASPLLCADPAPAKPDAKETKEPEKKEPQEAPASPFPGGPGGMGAPVEPSTLPAPDQPVAPVEPPVKELDKERVQIGDVILNRKTREIRFPAAVNMAGGELLEFALVHVNGKVHESLLVTETSATDINLAFKLLRYPASAELYSIANENGTMSNKFHEVADDVKAGARLDIGVEWEAEGKTRTAKLNDWISHGTTNAQMPAADPWVYGGSGIHDGKFVADLTGDYIAIFLSNAALINFSGKDNNSDEVWLPFPKRVPTEGTKVTVTITPHKQPAAKK
ncbi:YdjY domain-containing protein [Luteolibacter flavescens]|uniref:YdjY domain-containing protein n=1 Tax=Luteolibacter flavescens TaxID=1859460 RepID=A0ABT3FW33_9BACT|nr:YdjY domain-containing protein [Luteolibacter flavescens]MCW1887775.1 YdjY domain-containing protein [Luteolibacter flavescens]